MSALRVDFGLGELLALEGAFTEKD